MNGSRRFPLVAWLLLVGPLPGIAEEPEASAPVQAPAFELVDNALKLPRPVEFVGDTAMWTPESEAALEHVRDFLRAKPAVSRMRIEGHVNGEREDENAQRTSEQRALAVARWLKTNGIDCLRIVPVGFGATKPVASRETREGRMKNSRITFVVVEMRGRAVGGGPADGGGLEVVGTCD